MINALLRVAAVGVALGGGLVGGVSGCKSDRSLMAGTAGSAGSAQVARGSVIDAAAATDALDWRLAVLPVNPPVSFAAWDMPGRAQAWQGAWLSQPGAGFFVAIEVAGANVIRWDGKVENRLFFALESPCSAKFIERSTAGESSSTTHFTMRAGKLLAGLGDAGSRNDNAAIVCASDVILVLAKNGICTEVTPSFGKYNSAPGKCALRRKAGVEVFTATVHGSELELIVDGDAIYSKQLGTTPDQGFADFAAAKAAQR